MFRKLLTALVLVTGAILSSGCTTTETVYVSNFLPLPDRPPLPSIPSGELQCLTDDAYAALVERDVIQGEHIKRLEAIIRTTH